MKKIILLIAVILVLAVGASALKECQRTTMVNDIPCEIISSYHPSAGCGSYNMTIYNSSNQIIENATWGDYAPFCNVTFTHTKPQTYIWNSTLDSGVIVVEGDESQMILLLGIFILLINIAVAWLPFKARFSKSEAGNYVVKRMIWIAAILLLWFNMTMFRQLASDWGLGIDNFLEVYWWAFTMATFICIFLMVYYATVGGLKLMKEAQMKRRMGDVDA